MADGRLLMRRFTKPKQIRGKSVKSIEACYTVAYCIVVVDVTCH